MHFVSADEPTLRGPEWIAQHWEVARLQANRARSILVLDEVQKVPNWPEAVKRLWDEDTRAKRTIRVLVLCSAPLHIQRGLSESLAVRFEILHLPHWSPGEMKAAFGWSVEKSIFYGGYPGAATLVDDHERWMRYIRDAFIETTLSRDVLLLTRIDKPALLRRLFDLGCRYSGQILSYTKMLGQLLDAGNTTTLAHYLDLLSAAGLLTTLHKYSPGMVRQRSSSPKLQVFNTALLTALSDYTFDEAKADPEFWGRLTESAVGAHLVNAVASGLGELFYWRDHKDEVDFVVQAKRFVTAIEVKSGRVRDGLPGMAAFASAHKPDRFLSVGGDGLSIEDFLSQPADKWMIAS